MTARAEAGAAQRLAPTLPVDEETIGETIRCALRLGSCRPGMGELAAIQEQLRGHIALLLPLVREDVARLPADCALTHQADARLTSIEEQAQQPLLSGMLAAHSQVGGFARDCQYLLAMHAALARP